MLIWKPVSVFFFSLPPPIVCFLIAPPLMCCAAYAVPPSATASAISATIIAGDGRFFISLLITAPFGRGSLGHGLPPRHGRLIRPP